MDAFAPLFFAFLKSAGPDSKFRFAPTPSGFLHLGNALNFSLNWLAAQYAGGLGTTKSSSCIYLRIDDLDNDRKRPEYLEDIFESFRWLQLTWNAAPILQSEHLERYHLTLNRLRETGLLFACKKSRRDLEPFEGVYPPEFRDQGLTLDDPDVAWRLKTPPGFPMPDFVVRRRDGIPSYQVASFADDLFYGITHVIRGADLEHSTAAQVYLAELLSEAQFLKIKMLHHPLLLDESGTKLSKSAGSTALKTLRDAGQGPECVYHLLAHWLGLEGKTAQELLIALRAKPL